MAFVNIYKLSEYIKEKTDALLARYGHVNALAEILAPSIGTYDVQSSTDAAITVPLNKKAGIIQNVNMAFGTTIKLQNSYVNENSIVFYHIVPTDTTELTQIKSDLGMVRDISNTNDLNFMILPQVGQRVTGDIHFWIFN